MISVGAYVIALSNTQSTYCNIICVTTCDEAPSLKCVFSLSFPYEESQCVKRNEDPAVKQISSKSSQV